MKKLLILLFSILISFNSLGDEIKSLFGISLYDNAEKYVSSNYVDSNKFKNPETIEGYFDLDITDKIKEKSPYVSKYKITIDINHIVHSIYGERHYSNLSICQAIQKDLLSRLEEKYLITFEYWENSFPAFKIYSNFHYTSSDDYFAIQCNEDFEDSSIFLQIYLDTDVLGDATKDFYESGL